MTDTQIGFICFTIIMLTMFALVALRIWVDHKEVMRDKNEDL